MSLVGDRERDRAAASLRRHYLQGRLSAEELGERLHLALRARSTADLRAALRDLPPPWRTTQELLAPTARAAARAATFLALAAAWSFFSIVLLIVFVALTIATGPSATATLAFLLLWLALTYGVFRTWQRGGGGRI